MGSSTENRVFGSNFLSIMPGRRKSSRQRGSSIVFRGDYEIESGQGNDTASGRQTERRAVESPHDREARLFQGPLGDRERARQRYYFCSKRQTDRTPGRRKSSRQRGSSIVFRDDYEIESGQGNDTASGRQTERPAVESPHDREARLFQGPLGDRERARQRYCFWSKR